MRYGHATNSSSSHSVVFVPDKHVENVKEDLKGTENGTGFGWSDFIIKSPQYKRNYVMGLFWDSINNTQKDQVKAYLECFGLDLYSNDVYLQTYDDGYPSHYNLRNCYVDHQSAWTLPKNHKTDKKDFQFLKEFVEWFCNTPNVVVKGGNDNEESDFSCCVFEEANETLNQLEYFLDRRDSLSPTVLKDNKTGEWNIRLHKASGSIAKIYFGSMKTFKESNNTRPEFPILVDLKITNQCLQNCPFCYQDSHPEGKHAPFSKVEKTLQILKDWGVMDLVIGGGEPTLHPKLKQILKVARSKGFTTSLTTKNYNFGSHPQFHLILKYLNSLAISCQSLEDLSKADGLRQVIRGQNFHQEIYIQTIVELYKTKEEFIAFLDRVKTLGIRNITLLGLRPVGRAENGYNDLLTPSQWHDNLIEILQEYRFSFSIGMDAALIKKHYSLLDNMFKCNKPHQAGIHPFLYGQGDEGYYSCAIDLVALAKKRKILGIVSKSSFSVPDTSIKENPFAFKDLGDLKLTWDAWNTEQKSLLEMPND